jgi:predicted  nucleic acid-binding Zn-ribbon protein
MTEKKRKFKCPYCGHIWAPRGKVVKGCPHCKGRFNMWSSHLWGDKKRGIKGKGGWIEDE